MKKHPNSQGKGLAPVLESILARRIQAEIAEKNIEQIICELFTSQFVLQGEFKFCPVTNRSYWLYQKNNGFRLSMIKPHEWRNDCFGQFVAECVMQPDMTWTLTLSEQARHDKKFIRYVELLWQKFNKTITPLPRLKSVLPVYDSKLPFYQRVLASNLAFSLGVSLNKSLARLDASEVNLLESKNNVMLELFGGKN